MPHKLSPVVLFSSIALLTAPVVCVAADGGGVDALKKEVEQLKALLNAEKSRNNAMESRLAAVEKSAAAKPPAATKGANGDKAGAGKKATGAQAELDGKFTGHETIKELSEHFGVPSSPAAAALGLNPSKVQHVTTPKQLIPAIISGLDEKGHFQSGLSIDFAPFQMMNGEELVSKYRGGTHVFGDDATAYFNRVLMRTQISLATAKGSSDADKSTKVALGIHSVLIDANDRITADHKPGSPHGNALNEWVQDLGLRPVPHLPFPNEGFSSLLANKLWSHLSWSVGAASSFLSRDDNGDHFEYNGTQFWSSFSFSPTKGDPDDTSFMGMLNATQFFLDINYHQGEKVSAVDAHQMMKGAATMASSDTSSKSVDKSGMIDQDTLFVVAGLRFGTNDFNATVTGAYISEWQGHSHDTAFRYGIEVARRMTGTDTWMTVSIDKDTGHENGRNPTVVLGGMKIGFGGEDFLAKDQKKKN